jgi:hypothetical protein
MDTGKKRPKGPKSGFIKPGAYFNSTKASGWRSSPKAYPSSCAAQKTSGRQQNNFRCTVGKAKGLEGYEEEEAAKILILVDAEEIVSFYRTEVYQLSPEYYRDGCCPMLRKRLAEFHRNFCHAETRRQPTIFQRSP